MKGITTMHAQTEKLKPEISSCCLQTVKTNSLVEYRINTCLRHIHMSSVMRAKLHSQQHEAYVSPGSDN